MSENKDASSMDVKEEECLEAAGPSSSQHPESMEEKTKALLCSIQECSRSVIEGIETSAMPSRDMIKTYLENLVSSINYLKHHGPEMQGNLLNLCQLCDDMLRDIKSPNSKLPLLENFKLADAKQTDTAVSRAAMHTEEPAGTGEVHSNMPSEISPESPADSLNTENSGSIDIPVSPIYVNRSPSPIPDITLSLRAPTDSSTDLPMIEVPVTSREMSYTEFCKHYKLDQVIIPKSQFRTVREHYKLIVDEYKNYREGLKDLKDLKVCSHTRIAEVLVPIGFEIIENLIDYFEFVSGKAESPTENSCLTRGGKGMAFVKPEFHQNIAKGEEHLELYDRKISEIIEVLSIDVSYEETEFLPLKEAEQFININFSEFYDVGPYTGNPTTNSILDNAKSLRYFSFHIEGQVLSCIDTTKAILDFCIAYYTGGYDRRMKRFVDATLNVLRGLNFLRKCYYHFHVKEGNSATEISIEKILDFKVYFMSRFTNLLKILFAVNRTFWMHVTV